MANINHIVCDLNLHLLDHTHQHSSPPATNLAFVAPPATNLTLVAPDSSEVLATLALPLAVTPLRSPGITPTRLTLAREGVKEGVLGTGGTGSTVRVVQAALTGTLA